jgi:hypothetical protein
MPVTRPYHRTCRQFVGGSYSEGGRSRYIEHPKFAKSPEHYVRAFNVLLTDLNQLFEYIEPSEKNLSTYSFRTHELLIRACIEFEANCKAIFLENGSDPRPWDIRDYKKINKTHHLSSYEVKIPFWSGDGLIRKPFLLWENENSLPWYKAYNSAKHDRQNAFQQATFEMAIDSICGLLVILSSQFYTNDFSPADPRLVLEGYGDGLEEGIGGYFRVKFPDDWSDGEKYDFNWQEIRNEENPFDKIDYSKI